MLPEIAAAVSATRNLAAFFKTFAAVTTDEKVREAIIDAQNQIIELQSQVFEANSRYEEQAAQLNTVRKRLDELESWKRESDRYEQFEKSDGFTAFRLKDPQSRTEKFLWFCPRCFANHKLSAFQRLVAGVDEFTCPECELKCFSASR